MVTVVAMGLGRFAAGAALLAALLAACGSNHINLGSPPTTKPAGATTTTIDPTADGGQEAAILAAYRGSLADFNRVSTTRPLDPESPLLAQHMAGAKLTQVVSSLTKLAAAGQIDTGGITSLHAAVNQYTGSQAVVASCEHDRSAILDAGTHKTVGQPTDDTVFVNDLVVLQGDAWKVTEADFVSSTCQ